MTAQDKINLGSVQIHRKVLVDIILSALENLDGVKIARNVSLEKILGYFGKTDDSAVKIRVNDQEEVSMEIKVIVRYGLNIPDIAREIQEAVRSAVGKTVNITLKEIHINVQGIERGPK